MKKIVIISNVRMMFLFMLLNRTPLDEVFFIFDESLEHYVYKFKNTITVRKSKRLPDLFWLSIYYTCKFYYLRVKYKLFNLPVYGADHISGAKFFLRRHNFFLLEDGTANYANKSYHRSLKNRLFSIPVFGVHKNVKKIYLTSANNLPRDILHKVEIVNIKELWDSKSEREKKEIFDIFGVKDEILSTIREKIYILYTQPLSEDGVLSQEEKMDIYKSILSELRIDTKKLVIKTHPREKTNYYEDFPNSYVLREHIPAELIAISCHNFEKVVTLFSTSVYEHEKSLVHFYGTKVHNKLIERFGNIEFDH
ncbi:glycosyltransferase family 52 [Actinobacillus equuli]|uniref:glycosyltransferase family 52 n=1 Tax=Actinobacillus equuli TaxID=718 RepID=UPI0024467568|nr:glycosyltransferase family 52 [Actinobacillus equuli]WGE83401.1 glycosyltransferase family 52 protein [Actinobacillus equuli subsp. equuli]